MDSYVLGGATGVGVWQLSNDEVGGEGPARGEDKC